MRHEFCICFNICWQQFFHYSLWRSWWFIWKERSHEFSTQPFTSPNITIRTPSFGILKWYKTQSTVQRDARSRVWLQIQLCSRKMRKCLIQSQDSLWKPDIQLLRNIIWRGREMFSAGSKGDASYRRHRWWPRAPPRVYIRQVYHPNYLIFFSFLFSSYGVFMACFGASLLSVKQLWTISWRVRPSFKWRCYKYLYWFLINSCLLAGRLMTQFQTRDPWSQIWRMGTSGHYSKKHDNWQGEIRSFQKLKKEYDLENQDCLDVCRQTWERDKARFPLWTK